MSTTTLPLSPRTMGVDGVEIVDVVGGVADRSSVDDLVAMHRTVFPEYGFVADEIVADAAAHPQRHALTVHQWLIRCGDAPAALMLFDTNLARRVVLVHFLAVARAGRAVRIGGRRLSAWLCHQAQATLATELAEHLPGVAPLGVAGESAENKVRLWAGVGFRRLAVPYAEPIAGRQWRDVGDDTMRPLALLWLPPAGVDVAALSAPSGAAAAAFLIDHYGLPLDHPTVAATVGLESERPGARR